MSQIIDGMTWEDYKKAKGINASLLPMIERSPKHFKAALDGVYRQEKSDDLTFGSLFHAWVLEPETVQSTFHLRPDTFVDDEGIEQPWHGARKPCKKWAAEHADKPVVTSADIEAVKGMSEALRGNAAFMEHFEGGKSEQSLFAEDKHGTLLKGRLDRLKLTGNVLIDLKTTGSCTEESFQRDIQRFGYHRKAAFYLDLATLCGLKKDVFILVAIEKEPPYIHALWKLPTDWIKLGRMENNASLAKYRECVKTGVWAGPADTVKTISPVNWVQKIIDETL